MMIRVSMRKRELQMGASANQIPGEEGGSQGRPEGAPGAPGALPAEEPGASVGGPAKKITPRGAADVAVAASKEAGNHQGQGTSEANTNQSGAGHGRSQDMCEVWPD